MAWLDYNKLVAACELGPVKASFFRQFLGAETVFVTEEATDGNYRFELIDFGHIVEVDEDTETVFILKREGGQVFYNADELALRIEAT